MKRTQPTLVEEPLEPARAPVPETRKSKRNLRCVFTDRELLTIARILADNRQALTVLEGDKKRIVADLSAKMTAIESEMSVAANAISTGYEYRMVTCTETFDSPNPGQKTVRRDDTGEQIGIVDMTPDELQRELIPVEAGAAS